MSFIPAAALPQALGAERPVALPPPLTGNAPMAIKWISCALASLIIVAALTMFATEPRKAIGMAAAFCSVAGALWFYDALQGLRRGQ